MKFINNKIKNKIQINTLENRISILEDLLCPNKVHDWIRSDVRGYEIENDGVLKAVYQYTCSRCKKEIKEKL